MLTQTLKDVALAEFVARTSNPHNRRRHPAKLVEDAFAVAQQFVEAQAAYDAGQSIASADKTKPNPSPVMVQQWDPFMGGPKVDDAGKPVMIEIKPDVTCWTSLPFGHHHVQACLMGRLELGLPLPDIDWTWRKVLRLRSWLKRLGLIIRWSPWPDVNSATRDKSIRRGASMARGSAIVQPGRSEGHANY